jgi:cell division protein FtsI/penicillin-binding protein 2
MRPWFLGAASLAVAAGLAPFVLHRFPTSTVAGVEAADTESVAASATATAEVDDVALSHAVTNAIATAPAPTVPAPMTAAIAMTGLDLRHIAIDDSGANVAFGNKRVARLTVDPELQRTAVALLATHHLPEASIVMIDPATGTVLAYASHVEAGPARDLCAEATAPAASVFKVVTGSALVQDASLTPDTRECYAGGGDQRILASDLEVNEARDKWCVTLGGAMGKSTNTVFARLAQRHLKPKLLEDMAQSFGFNEAVPFDVPVQPSTLKLPTDALGYARTAAGFWNSTLSPIEAAWMSATVARGGESPRLSIVKEVSDAGTVVYTAPGPSTVHRVMSRDTAQAVTAMMEHTVTEGTSYRAFHDGSGSSFLPGVSVAGKTGTLADAEKQHLYTWFTGFAPSRPLPGVKPVAIGVLVVNNPTWRVKANVIAREMLRAWFASQKVEHVTKPPTARVARR